MLYLVGAGALSALWFAVHLILGGREIAAPLRQSTELTPVVRDTQYLCWHFTTCAIAVMAGCFLAAAYLDDPKLAWPGIALAFGFSTTGIGLVTAIGQSHAKLPQGWLFVPVTILGLLGVLLP